MKVPSLIIPSTFIVLLFIYSCLLLTSSCFAEETDTTDSSTINSTDAITVMRQKPTLDYKAIPWRLVFVEVAVLRGLTILALANIAAIGGLFITFVTIAFFYVILASCSCCGCTCNSQRIRKNPCGSYYQSIHYGNDVEEAGNCFSRCKNNTAETSRGYEAVFTPCRVIVLWLIFAPLVGWLIWPQF